MKIIIKQAGMSDYVLLPRGSIGETACFPIQKSAAGENMPRMPKQDVHRKDAELSFFRRWLFAGSSSFMRTKGNHSPVFSTTVSSIFPQMPTALPHCT